MGLKSSISTLALNGSASESIYESDTTVGTLQNEEEWDGVPNRQERLPEKLRSFQQYPSRESQARPTSESCEEHPWADKDRGGPLSSSTQMPIERYLGDPDYRKQFFITGKAIEQEDIAERNKSISTPAKRRTGSIQLRRNTVKRIKQLKMEGPKAVDGEKRKETKAVDEKGNSKICRRNKRRAVETSQLVEYN